MQNYFKFFIMVFFRILWEFGLDFGLSFGSFKGFHTGLEILLLEERESLEWKLFRNQSVLGPKLLVTAHL